MPTAAAVPTDAATVPCTSDNAVNVTALRGAIAAANAAGSGSITLAPACTYTLTEPDNSPTYTTANGLPIVTGAVTIAGQGATVRRAPDAATPGFRFFQVASGGSLRTDQLTLRGGTGSSGGAVLVLTGGAATVHASTLVANRAGMGGAIALGTGTHLALDESTVTGSVADGAGGGIFNGGVASIAGSTVSGNSAAAGGGVENDLATVSISGSTLAANTAQTNGGGLDSQLGNATVDASTVTGNAAAFGGGVYNSGALLVVNTTVSGNRAAVGAGVANHHFLATVVNSTLAANTVGVAGDGGAVYNEGGDFRVVDTILASNADANCNNRLGTAVIDGGHNLSYPADDGSCPASVGHGDPMLGPLQDNGGPTQTTAPALGSAAIDAGDDSVCAAPVAGGGAGGTDQRAVVRPQGRHCDIGAVEVAHGIRLLYDPSLARPGGVPISIRLQLLDPEGANASSPSITLRATGVESAEPSLDGRPAPTSVSTPLGCTFSEDAGHGGQYRCLLRTTSLPAGQYQLLFMAGDGPSVFRAPFTVGFGR